MKQQINRFQAKGAEKESVYIYYAKVFIFFTSIIIIIRRKTIPVIYIIIIIMTCYLWYITFCIIFYILW